MSALAKRASRPFVKSIDDYSLAEVVAQVDTCLQTYDAEVALALARRICKATKAGEWSFDDAKLLALYEMADALSKGVPPTSGDRDTLRKAANALRSPVGGDLGPMPHDLRAKADRVLAANSNASTPVEKAAAEQQAVALHGEMTARDALAKCLAKPLKMGAST